jgi:hypothetical protein
MEPLSGACVWTGPELAANGRWLRELDAPAQAEIDAALAAVKRRGLPVLGFGRQDFPLPRTAELLAGIAEELENGCGAVRLRGLAPERYTEDDLRRIFWGLGTHLGTALYQNGTGEIMGEVRDETGDPTARLPKAEPGKVLPSRIRARSTGPLRFHTDSCDVIALLAVSNGMAGGVSKLASIPHIHNAMLRRRPDLLALLFEPFWRRRTDEAEAARAGRHVSLPVFGLQDGRFTSQYSRTFVEQAQEEPGIPRLTAAHQAALDLLAEIAEASCLHAPFEAGDLQLLNNHVVYHGRTAYQDDAGQARRRLLLRLWLAVPNSRPLPAGFETYWGETAAGALRGGVVQADGSRAPFPAVGRVRAAALA